MSTEQESAAIEFCINLSSLHYYSCHSTVTKTTIATIKMLITRLHQLGKIAQFSETIIEQAIRNNQNDSPAKQNRKCVSCGSEFEVVKDLKIMGRTFRSSQDMCPTCEKKEHDKKVMVCLKETLKGRL